MGGHAIEGVVLLWCFFHLHFQGAEPILFSYHVSVADRKTTKGAHGE